MCCNPGIFTSGSHFQPPCHSPYKWRRNRDLNPGHIGGRRMLWPLRHPCVRCCLRFQSSHHQLLLNILLVLNFVDCKTVCFFLKISKKKGKVGVRVLRVRSARASQALPRENLASLPSLDHCFQPRFRPSVWLLARTWIPKNTDCFAVY